MTDLARGAETCATMPHSSVHRGENNRVTFSLDDGYSIVELLILRIHKGNCTNISILHKEGKKLFQIPQ